MRPPVAEHVPLHSKSLCKNIARASGGGGGANNMRPLSWGHKRKKSNFFKSVFVLIYIFITTLNNIAIIILYKLPVYFVPTKDFAFIDSLLEDNRHC